VVNFLSDELFKLENKDVKGLCSKKVFDRGLGYFREGRVSNTLVYGLILHGEVAGNEPRSYKIKIKYDEKEGRLIARCTCPFDLEEFCKHSVALLLQWIHRREEFLNIDLVLNDLRTKSKEEILRLIEESIRTNPSIINYLLDTDCKTFKKQLEALFSNHVNYYDVRELIEKLEELRDAAEKLFEKKNVQESFDLLKEIIDLCIRNYGNVDDSDGIIARFIEDSVELYSRIIQVLNVEWIVKQKIHEDNWKMFVMDEYGLSDYISKMIVDSCTTENDFNVIEKLALEELQKRKDKEDGYAVSEIVDILLDIYEKKKDDEKFLFLCEKEFKHSYLRYIEYLETKRQINEAAQCCTRALYFAKGFLKTDLIEKLGDLKYAQGSYGESLSLYIEAFEDRREEKLLKKIRHLSEELGLWKNVRDKLISFLKQKGDSHNLIKIYLKEGDLTSAFKVASLYITNRLDAESVAKASEESMPHKAAEIYRNIAEESIKQSDRNSYRAAKYYYKSMKRLYTSLGKAEQFRYYIDGIKLANKRKHALQEELSNL
jgi:uncharacterized Zn finger protein